MQSKTTRAFRTISEAAEELDLQPHVLRFWESKFPSFKPIKRGGGRRFYRPEDIEFLRGIKILLHDERHPIKDVQKLIRVKGAARVADLGRSIKKAAIQKDVKDTVLVPEYVRGTPSRAQEVEINAEPSDEFEGAGFFPDSETESVKTPPEVKVEAVAEPAPAPKPVPDPVLEQEAPAEVYQEPEIEQVAKPSAPDQAAQGKGLLGSIYSIEAVPTGLTDKERKELELALDRLHDLRRQWQSFKQDTPPQSS